MEQRHLKMTESFGVIVVMFLILGTLIIKYKMSPQIPILCVFTLLLFYGRLRGFTWEQVIDGIAEGIKPGIIPMMIFMMIGLLISTWLASGTIATIMVIGFDLVSVKFLSPLSFWLAASLASSLAMHLRRFQRWAWPLWELATF